MGEVVEENRKRLNIRKRKAKTKKYKSATRKRRNKKPRGNKHRFKIRQNTTTRGKRRNSIKTQTKPAKKLQNVTGVENEIRNTKLCNTSFHYGEMCPILYTELGGYCEHIKTYGDVLDCPDIRKQGRTGLRSTQLVLTRMLKIFDIIARKHNIEYWITSGTLLGAARHQGFIPWDEDADIQMTLGQYIKLFRCCKDEFPKGMFFQNSETDPHLSPSSSTEKVALMHSAVGLYEQPWNPRLRDTKSCTKYCLTENCKWEDGLMIDIFIAEDTLTSHQRAGVLPLKQMTFEGFRFPVPNNWREILEYKYGDYEAEIGEHDSREPEDIADPFHSCKVLKKRRKNRKKKKNKF
ncbi:hypothetical protein QZH41_002682 [Actinostola sp. cb2023]|nr:hypothetical protein QZH41_002682 [Actinostola sp. cb2023]